MQSSKTPTNSNSNGKKDCGNGWTIGIGLLVVVIFLFVAFGIWGTCTDSGKSTFANIKSGFGNLPGIGGGDLRSLDIVMFMSPTCPWCKKMMGVLDSAGQLKNITVVDVTKPEGAAMAQQFGADKQPVPSFISRKNKVGTVGYRDSVSKLIDALKQPAQSPQSVQSSQPAQAPGSSEEPGMPGMPGQIDINFIKALQIVLFARDGCGWCQKAKENLAQAGVMDVIQVVDITTPEGQSLAGQMLPPGTSGVPAWVSMATKKHVIGFKPFDQIIQSLQNGNIPNVMS